MRVLLFFIPLTLLLFGISSAQQIYQIRADSVRIYNVCDTAELIIENRTQHTNGFLYNKGAGRTEFRRVKLEKIGASQIAITGQDTLDLSTLPGIGGIDTIYREGDNILYYKKGKLTSVYAPVPAFAIIPDHVAYAPGDFSTYRVVGFDAYDAPDMPLTSDQSTGDHPPTTNYYTGHVVWNGYRGYQMAVNWDGEDKGVRGAFIRGKDDNRSTWGTWRELLFKDYGDQKYLAKSDFNPGSYINNQTIAAQNAGFWVSGVGKVGGMNGDGHVALVNGTSTHAGYIAFAQPGPGAPRIGYIGWDPDKMLYCADIGYHNFAQQIESEQMGRFKGWYKGGDGKATELGISGDAAHIIGFDRTNKSYIPTFLLGSEINIETRDPQENRLIRFSSNSNRRFNIGTWIIDGHSDGWSGLVFPYAQAVPTLIFNSNSHGGIYQQSTNRWILFWDEAAQKWSTNGNDFWHAGNLNPQASAIANSAALRDASGNLIANGFYQGSKASLKKNIQPFTEHALSLLDSVSIKQFVYKDDKDENVRIGIIADNTDWHFSTRKHDRFDTNSSLAITMKAVQELHQENEALKKQNEKLQSALETVMQKMADLEQQVKALKK